MEKQENQPMTYKEKFQQANKEAKYTFLLFMIMMIWWFVTGLGLKDVEVYILGIPLWAALSSFGTVIIASVGNWILTRFFFKNFDFEEDGKSGESGNIGERSESEATKMIVHSKITETPLGEEADTHAR